VALSGHALVLTNVCFEGNKGHDADMTRCLLMTLSRHPPKSHCLLGPSSMRAGDSNPTAGLVQSGESVPATFASCQPFQNFPRIYQA
jgi:hypothetical protein